MLTPQLSIFSPGDWITFLIALVLGVIGFFILLGWIKRRREVDFRRYFNPINLIPFKKPTIMLTPNLQIGNILFLHAGDVIAVLLGIFALIIGFFMLLGFIKRRRG
eukprot:gene1641-12766_t